MALAEGKVPLPTQLGYWAVVRAIQEVAHPTFTKVDLLLTFFFHDSFTYLGPIAHSFDPPSRPPSVECCLSRFYFKVRQSMTFLKRRRGFSKNIFIYVSRCLDKDPVTRLLPGKLLDHPFLTINRATLSNLSSSPPVKPTVSLIAHVRQLAKAAADWHVGQNGASNGDIVTSIHTTFVEGTNQSSRRHALPDMSKIDSLARQLNIPVEAVDDTFREEWRCRGWIS
jgi:hypothetical protein